MRPQRLPANSRGFSLVELMVVLAVISVLAGFSYSGFISIQKREQLKAAALQLVSDLKEAKVLSIEKRTSYAITFTNSEYLIFRDPDSDFTYTDGTTPAHDILRDVDISTNYTNISINPAVDFALRFNSKGLPLKSTAWPCSIVLVSSATGRYCTVTVSSAGMIDVATCTGDDPDCMDLTSSE
ncbi:MAG: prepilin-type N-terminal cleavage/methylation domain-containing protein [Syntrophobacteraceae bacterium]